VTPSSGDQHIGCESLVADLFIIEKPYFSVLRDHWLYVCLHLKIEFRSCARGRQWCAIFYCHRWTASIKPRLLFSHSGLVSWGLPFLQFNTPYFPLGHFASRFFYPPRAILPHCTCVPCATDTINDSTLTFTKTDD